MHLLAAIKRETLVVPVAKVTLPRGDLDRFDELISSDLFRRYSEAHDTLAEVHRSNAKALALVKLRAVGRLLLDRFEIVLRLPKVGVALLAVSSKLVDLAFGKLPGALADLAVRLAAPLLEERRQVVIYQYDSMASRLLKARIRSLEHGEPPQAGRKAGVPDSGAV